MIKVLNSNLERLGVLKQVNNASRFEELNGENTLDFDADLDDGLKSVIDENVIFEVDNNYFDIAKFIKDVNEDDTVTIDVESEHVSYRLNREEYNVDYFTEQGTPTYILGRILEGTGFTVGTVAFTEVITYSAQESMSRRRLLMEFVAYLKGEIEFNKFQVNIPVFRGNQAQRPLIKGKNVTVVSKIVNKREKDADGNTLVSYKCTPIYLPGDVYNLGDSVRLIQQDLGINESFRLVSITTNPYDLSKTTFQLANYINGLEDRLYRIETSTVVKDKIYNGTRIGPEYGFEATRSDNKARAYFRSDGMVFQSGDGSGTVWRDRLKYEYDAEYDETTLVFDGKFTAGAIEAIKANIDIVVSNTVITNVLSAKTGNIAELTVDRLESSNKVARYYATPTDTSDMYFTRQIEQNIEFIEASVVFDGGVPVTEQLTDRYGLTPLYWIDAIRTGIDENETAWPVMVYKYNELVKLQISFENMNDDGHLEAVIKLGAGAGNELHPDWGKSIIYKDVDGVAIDYYKSSNGEKISLHVGENGPYITSNTGSSSLRNIAIGPAQPTTPQNNDLWIDTDA